MSIEKAILASGPARRSPESSDRMFSGQTVGVVIPCYRVEAQVRDVISRIPAFVDVVIAVNDASPDDTLGVLRSIDSPRLVVLNHERNRGVGGAMATGFRYALAASIDIVAKIDGDGQMDPRRLQQLIEPIAEGVCDYAKANRFLHLPELRRMPWTRKLGNIALTFLTKMASGYWHIFDPQNGYLAIRSDYLAMLDLRRLATRRFFFENEMLIQLNVESARALDCPMPAFYGRETSTLSAGRTAVEFPRLLLAGFCRRLLHRYVLRDFSMVVPLYAFGAVLFLWGVFFGAYTWIRAAQTEMLTPTGTVMLSVLPLILGFQMLMQGLLIEMLQAPRAAAAPTSRRSGTARQPQDLPDHEEPFATDDAVWLAADRNARRVVEEVRVAQRGLRRTSQELRTA